MKVLFKPLIHPDYIQQPEFIAEYTTDSLYHGLKTVLGHDLVDAWEMWHMHEKGIQYKHQIYGRGFTLYGLLNDVVVDRTNLEEKIKDGYFDKIILTVHSTRTHGYAS